MESAIQKAALTKFGNDNNIEVTINKDWIRDANGNQMTSDFSFSFNVDATLQNIDLHKAIAVAIKNNRDLRISVMESALAQRQNNLQRFENC